MKWMSYLLSLAWRLWLLINFIFFFFLFSPLLFLFTAIFKNNKMVNYITRYWAGSALILSGILWKIEFEEKLDKNKQYIFCANHTSSLDIPLITTILPVPVLYMGKKELEKIPLFGYFFKHNSVVVNRSNLRDSYDAFLEAGKKIDQGLNICIFPEGGIPKSSVFLKKFKNGPFKLAIEKDIHIVPITLADNKNKFPQEYYKGSPGFIRGTVHKPLKLNPGQENAIENLNTSVYNIIFDQLKEYEGK